MEEICVWSVKSSCYDTLENLNISAKIKTDEDFRQRNHWIFSGVKRECNVEIVRRSGFLKVPSGYNLDSILVFGY